MATLYRVRVPWTGFTGAPGVSTFYLSLQPTTPDIAALRTFFNSASIYLPTPVRIQVPNQGDTLDSASGELTGTWGGPALPAQVTGSGGTAYAGPAGAMVRWLTGGVVHRRKVIAKTFLVPLAVNFDTDGTLSSTAVSALQTASSTLVSSLTTLTAWSRPFPGGTGNPPRTGSAYTITGAVVPDKVVVLRSRRD